MVAFGDTYDNLSIALDNIQGGGQPDSPNGTSGIRHNQLLNYCFVDGHAHTIRMVMATYNGGNDGGALVFLPTNQSDALDWCYDPNATGDYSSQGVSGYPIDSNGETCTNVVAGLYVNSKVAP